MSILYGITHLKVIEIPFNTLAKEYQLEVLGGYSWGCECGEAYETLEGVEQCRNCRKYLQQRPSKAFYTPLPDKLK